MRASNRGILNRFRSVSRLIILPGLIVVLFACDDRGSFMSSRPGGILSKDKMTDVLVDINLAESSMRVGSAQHFSLADSMYQKSMYLYVFDKHHVTPDEFRNSLKYYTKDIDALNEIFSGVIDRLSVLQAETAGKVPEDQNKKKPDSGEKASSAQLK